MSPARELHPNDRAVLYDLLDDRLAPRAADEVRRRLADEPDFKAAYDQLVEIRTRLAAPLARALPADFVERVRAQAGFPPPAQGAGIDKGAMGLAAAPHSAPAPKAGMEKATGNESASVAASDLRGRVGRMLVFARVAYAIAAVLVVALGVAWWTLSPGRETAVQTESAKELRVNDPSKDNAGAAAAMAVTVDELARKDAATANSTGDEAPMFRGPVGAAPPGVRTPSDSPVLDAAPRRPVPASTPSPDPARLSTPEATASGRSGTSVGVGGGAADGGVGGGGAATRAGPARRARSAPVLPPSVHDDADDVLVVYADSYDEARAEVALLVADARSGRLPVARRTLAGERLEGAKKSAAPAADSKAKEDKSAPEGAGDDVGTERDAPDSKAPSLEKTGGSPAPIGTFVVDLEPGAFARLTQALEAERFDGSLADETRVGRASKPTSGQAQPSGPAQPPAPPPAPSAPGGLLAPPSAPAPTPHPAPAATPPATPARGPVPAADEDGKKGEMPAMDEPSHDATGVPAAPAEGSPAPVEPIRRVRIVVLPRPPS